VALAWFAVIEGITGQLLGSALARRLPFYVSEALSRSKLSAPARLLRQWGGGLMLLGHVAAVMSDTPPPLPVPGTGAVAENLRRFIDGGLEVLGRVRPAFARLVTQPKVLARFHAMVGGNAAFGAGPPGRAGAGSPDRAATTPEPAPGRGRGLPDLLSGYLQGERRLGRVAEAADIDAVVILIVGAIHGQVLPRLIFSPPGTVLTTPADVPGRLAETILAGIAPR
jgi:hypothetical protein